MTKEGKPKVMVVTTLEWSLSSTMDTEPSSVGKGDDEMVDNPPATDLILKAVPTLGVFKREVSALLGGEGSGVKAPTMALAEIIT